MQIDLDILITIATLVVILGGSSSLAGWVDGRRPWVAILALAGGVGLLAWVHLDLKPGGLRFRDIPDAFIHVAAMILN
jgi:hypothetical protein